MRPAAPACLVLVLALVAGCAQPAGQGDPTPGTDDRSRLDAAIAYLEASREPDGRWPAAQVPYVVEAAAAAGLDLHAWPRPVPVADQVSWPPPNASFMASLRPLHAVALVDGGGAADGDGERRAEVRKRVLAGFDGAQFGEPALLNDDAFALVVLGAAGADAATWAEVGPAVDGLLGAGSPGGGWSWTPGGAAETDMTGLVLHALSQAGALDRVDADAVRAFLATTRNAGGGHSLHPNGEPNCDSSVWAIRALGDLGEPAGDATWGFLLRLQGPDGGFAFLPGGPANDLCTAEAATLLGLLVHGLVPSPASRSEGAASG